MNKALMIDPTQCYKEAEQRAADYFAALVSHVREKDFIPILTQDFNAWKQQHIHQPSLFSIFSRKKKGPDSTDYHSYIQWMRYSGKLDPYLDRSISYLFMRDLGKDLNEKKTQKRVRQIVDDLKEKLTKDNAEQKSDFFSSDGLYRKAQEEGIPNTYIWLMEKLEMISTQIPEEMDADHAVRKLIKIIAGVLMHVREEMGDETPDIERAKRLDEAIRLGYAYGLTYPFIDDLLDAKILSQQEETQYSELIRTSLTTGVVPELGDWNGKNKEFITFVHSELREAFEYIKNHQQPSKMKSFFEEAYVFFQSQEVDRKKALSNPHYKNEELFIPVILKSFSSRSIIRSVLSAPEDEGFESRTFYYGIYNQLADDFADLFDDLQEGSVTPYTYYWKYHDERPDLINPFELYWSVISHLIHHVYRSDAKTREVILDRAINGLKRFKEKIGDTEYEKLMNLLTSDMPQFNSLIQKMVEKADDVDFFDKLLRDHMITNLKRDRQERETFIDTVEKVRLELNTILPLTEKDLDPSFHDHIVEAANYSLVGDGKRLRPVMAWMMGVEHYGLSPSEIEPLLKSLEYMHTASLILDDLPSQDNASIRRGRQTVHKVYNVATAELTSLFLTQKAIEEQTNLQEFHAKTVLQLIRYSSRVTAEMCKGQAMDLESKGKTLTLEQLNTMCFYKTGIGFEAALIMPAILAMVEEEEIQALKRFARHAGVAFQIKDDLLDVEGTSEQLGKPVGDDAQHMRSTFVTILGVEGAKQAMWDQYSQAMETIEQTPKNIPFLKHLLNYIIHRKK
ncbi:polyprenyl synthetase family protein [Niallia sp. Krafla_26]|uniref:polyprenyl synthetase family protein n=1 Tax=Niallia sp. Krafla_26 TaxID=3064703 RepID=UPI003D163485